MEKFVMNQDEFYQYLLSRHLTVKRLGELLGLSDTVMSSAFKHHVVNGKPLYFSADRLKRINEALPVMAHEINARRMTFTPSDSRYDFACVEQLHRVGDYFNLKALTADVLGWTKSKKDACFSRANKGYGHITEADVAAINAKLTEVAMMLQQIEVVGISETDSPETNK